MLPRDPQERIRSKKPLNRTDHCELGGDFISSHSGMPRDPIEPHSVRGIAYYTVSASVYFLYIGTNIFIEF